MLSDLVFYVYTCMSFLYSLPIYQMDTEKVAPFPLVDLSRPRYNQSTFTGRAKHFFETTDPRNLLASHERLEAAATLVKQYK